MAARKMSEIYAVIVHLVLSLISQLDVDVKCKNSQPEINVHKYELVLVQKF